MAWDITSAVISQWKLNDNATNTTVVDSVGSNTGTCDVNTDTIDATGKINGGLTFNGTTTIVNCGTATSLDNLSPFSVAAWIYPNSVGENNLGYIAGKPGGWSLNLATAATPRVSFTRTAATSLVRGSANGTITLSAWNFVVMTWDGDITNPVGSCKLYINGSETTYLVRTAGVAPNGDDSAGNFCIGNRDTDTARTFNGIIDNVIVCNRVLTSTEILGMWNSGSGTENLNDDINITVFEPAKVASSNPSLVNVNISVYEPAKAASSNPLLIQNLVISVYEPAKVSDVFTNENLPYPKSSMGHLGVATGVESRIDDATDFATINGSISAVDFDDFTCTIMTANLDITVNPVAVEGNTVISFAYTSQGSRHEARISGVTANYTYSVDDSSILELSGQSGDQINGTGMKKGTTTVRCTYNDGFNASVTQTISVTVN